MPDRHQDDVPDAGFVTRHSQAAPGRWSAWFDGAMPDCRDAPW